MLTGRERRGPRLQGRVEVHEHLATLEVTELDLLAGLVQQGEGGGLVSGLQHAGNVVGPSCAGGPTDGRGAGPKADPVAVRRGAQQLNRTLITWKRTPLLVNVTGVLLPQVPPT